MPIRPLLVASILFGPQFVLQSTADAAHANVPIELPRRLAGEVKTYKVTLSKSDEGKNRTVYIQAKDSAEARETAKEQNPGWRVENVSEVK